MSQYFLVKPRLGHGPVEIGPVGGGRAALASSRSLLPERFELSFVDHQQADEHEEPPQHHGGRHPFRGVVLGVESLLFGSQSIKSSGGVGFLAGCQKGRRKFSGRQKGT